MSTRVVAILPARMGSSRFPGKPLLPIRGLPMIEHVRRRALLCGRFSDVVVATCDREIREAVERFGGRVVMTSPAHPAATDRVAEAAERLEATHVVNVQGDEILVLPSDLEAFVRAIESRPELPAWNGLARLEREAELADPSVVKCVVSASNRVLYCSRDFSRLPVRAAEGFAPVRRVLGILAYRWDLLARYGALPRTPLERAEGIDQSRLLEHEIHLQGAEFSGGYPGINEPREVSEVERLLDTDAAQQVVLQQILDAAVHH